MELLCTLGTLFMCISSIQIMVFALGGFKKTVQEFRPVCNLTQPCPAMSVLHASEWQHRQRTCCYLKHGLLFHCQYQKYESDERRQVVACLPNSTCSAGTYAKLFTESKGNRTSAWVECLPCSSTHYEEQEKPTYMYSYDRCADEKLDCKKKFGKTLCTEGGPQADNKCRCLYEDGYSPFPDNESCLCFNKTANCECRQKNCSQDEELNEAYMCVRKLVPTGVTETTPGSPEVVGTTKPTPLTEETLLALREPEVVGKMKTTPLTEETLLVFSEPEVVGTTKPTPLTEKTLLALSEPEVMENMKTTPESEQTLLALSEPEVVETTKPTQLTEKTLLALNEPEVVENMKTTPESEETLSALSESLHLRKEYVWQERANSEPHWIGTIASMAVLVSIALCSLALYMKNIFSHSSIKKGK